MKNTHHHRSRRFHRGWRRHHRRRMIAHALRCYAYQDQPERAHKDYNHLQACSCWACGNPRKWVNVPPAQERRLAESARADGENCLH